jgi:hypothetical protein
MEIPKTKPPHPERVYFHWFKMQREAKEMLLKDKSRTTFWSNKISEAEEKMLAALMEIDPDLDFEP